MEASAKRIPEGTLTVKRGEKVEIIDFQGIPVEVKLRVFTNDEVNRLSEEFTEIVGSEINVDLTRLGEERIIRGLLDIDTTFFGGRTWPELNDEEKREAIRDLHPELCDKIGHAIFGKTHLSKEDKDFLRNRLSQAK